MAGLVVVLTMSLGAGAAQGEAAPVADGSWYWAAQIPDLGSVGGQSLGQPAALPTPDVPEGDFPVALSAGSSTKETYLHLDTSAIPDGSTVSRFVLTLSEDAAATNTNSEVAAIQAVPVADFWVGGDAARPFEERPAVSTTTAPVAGVRQPDGTWTFDLTSIVSEWVSGAAENNGVALVPKPDPTGTFQVVWSGASPPPTTEGEFTPPAGETVPPSDDGFISEPTTPGSVSLEPDFSATPVTPTLPAAPPVATGDTPSSGEGAPRTIAATAKRGLPFSFYVAGLLVLLGAAAGTIALGERGEPLLERRGSVLRVLERRAEQRSLLEEPT
jgi:hypothetical protein